MTRLVESRTIRLRGVRQNNLKGIDLDLPVGKLVVMTGLSGSGKSSLAFDTLYAEGQRRYIETFSPYARQFFDRIDKPLADSIEGIPPAIAVEQRNAVRTTRSTVGTMTEICDYAKLIWHHLAVLHCKQCGKPVVQESPQDVWQALQGRSELVVAFRLPLSEKMSLQESLELVARQGYQRLLVRLEPPQNTGASADLTPEGDGAAYEVIAVMEAAPRLRGADSILIVQDRISQLNRPRLVEACEQAYHFGKGKLEVFSLKRVENAAEWVAAPLRRFSRLLHCASCNLDYKPASPALFSFNNPLGACPSCHGFGRIISIDYSRALPDRSKTLGEGAIKPWQSGVSAECQDDMRRFSRLRGVPFDVPFEKLSRQHQDWVLNGDPHYGEGPDHEWPKAWYGVKGYFQWLESKSYKMHVRVLLSRYRAYTECPACRGRRLQPEALLYRMAQPEAFADGNRDGNSFETGLVLSDFYQLPLRKAHQLVEGWLGERQGRGNDPLVLAMKEVQARLGYLVEAGLGYLTLDRPTRSLSGGETERVHLTTCLGSRLVNTLFILDEPSVGLHSRDTGRLVAILQKLRDAGNTVVVVEHEASVMRAADEIVDLGPGSGEKGGKIIFHGKFADLLKSKTSLTGRFLSGRSDLPAARRRPVPGDLGAKGAPALRLSHARLHNLKDVTAEFPLGRFVCVTGVSGSGKSTLIRDVLLPAIQDRLAGMAAADASGEDADNEPDNEPGEAVHLPVDLQGCEHLGGVVLVDQSSLGKTPRSNPILYIGAFDLLRAFFAHTPEAAALDLEARDFSFNARAGQCPKCRGAGHEKIEMQFLSDVLVKCPDCNGRRYSPRILQVKVRQPAPAGDPGEPGREWSVADMLDATVDEAMSFLVAFTDSKHAKGAMDRLRYLQKTGLGYLRLGQPINTLSGGECQRLKLVRHIADSAQTGGGKGLLFLFDEPTTGLHFEDVRVLTGVFQQLVDEGHTVLVVEHHLDMIQAADWVIDMGPEGGDEGGQIVASGTPETISACKRSHTGMALIKHRAFRRNPLVRHPVSAPRQTGER
jgi:excinuclease ABC subunit A